MKNFVCPTWDAIESYCESAFLFMRYEGYKPDCVIALLRGGVVPARLFSDYFHVNLDFSVLDVKLYNGIGTTNDEVHVSEFYGNIKGKNILIVDDIWDSGRTMRAVLKYFSTYETSNIKTCTVYLKENAEGKPDYYSEIAKEDEWVVFPWEKYEMGLK